VGPAVPRATARLVLVGSPGLSAELLQPLDLQRWDLLPAGAASLAAHRHNLLQLMLAREASASELAVALHAHNVERDRLRKRGLMLTDALVPILPRLRCPVHGLWGAQDVLYRHRLPLIGQVLSLAPGLQSLELLPDAGHWVQFEAADAFNTALGRALSAPQR
jgi:2-hydroxy-6-oxonona-2,4-dienedioate hydrolase